MNNLSGGKKGGFVIDIKDIKLETKTENIQFSHIALVIDFYKIFIGQIKVSSAIIYDSEIGITAEKGFGNFLVNTK